MFPEMNFFRNKMMCRFVCRVRLCGRETSSSSSLFTNAEESEIKRPDAAILVDPRVRCTATRRRGSEVQLRVARFARKRKKTETYRLVLAAGRNQCAIGARDRKIDGRYRPRGYARHKSSAVFFFLLPLFLVFSAAHPPVARSLSGVFRSLSSPVARARAALSVFP